MAALGQAVTTPCPLGTSAVPCESRPSVYFREVPEPDLALRRPIGWIDKVCLAMHTDEASSHN
jgi:hypothetical protein